MARVGTMQETSDADIAYLEVGVAEEILARNVGARDVEKGGGRGEEGGEQDVALRHCGSETMDEGECVLCSGRRGQRHFIMRALGGAAAGGEG